MVLELDMYTSFKSFFEYILGYEAYKLAKYIYNFLISFSCSLITLIYQYFVRGVPFFRSLLFSVFVLFITSVVIYFSDRNE